ncbi:MAG: histidine kinase N-terminal 7TM domain-containing protein [Coriobacteriia bacterium]|nr:histidine kinase N-terminal 7TM domain-containing protein [Coriobacteriia bacterium]
MIEYSPAALARYVYIASGLVAVYGMVLARRHIRAPGSRWLVLLAGMSAVWMFANALTHMPLSVEARTIWAYVSAIGVYQGALWFLFALEYCIRGFRASRALTAVLLVVPALLMVAAATNPLHGWFWTSIALDPQTDILILTRGPLYTATIILGVAAFAPATLLFVIAAYRSRGLYRTQSIALVIALVAQIATYSVFMSLSEWPPGLYPAMSTGVAMGVVAFAIERLQFLAAVPVGRAEMFDSTPDAHLVFDLSGRIADANHAARDLLGAANPQDLQGLRLEEALTGWSGLGLLGAGGAGTRGEVTAMLETPAGRRIDARAWPLRDASGGMVGTATVLRDVTDVERTRIRLEEATSSVASWVQEMNAVEEFVSRSRKRL